MIQFINIPPLDKLIDITLHRLHEFEETMLLDPDEEDEELAANHDPSPDIENDDEDWGQSSFQLGGELLVKFSKFSFSCLCTYVHFCSFPFTSLLWLWLRKRFYWQWSILSLSSFIIFANLFGLTNYFCYILLYFSFSDINLTIQMFPFHYTDKNFVT